jgi:hypothetical protein
MSRPHPLSDTIGSEWKGPVLAYSGMYLIYGPGRWGLCRINYLLVAWTAQWPFANTRLNPLMRTSLSKRRILFGFLYAWYCFSSNNPRE